MMTIKNEQHGMIVDVMGVEEDGTGPAVYPDDLRLVHGDDVLRWRTVDPDLIDGIYYSDTRGRASYRDGCIAVGTILPNP